MDPHHTTSPTHPVDFKADLLGRLKDQEYAREYLLAAFDEARTDGNWCVLSLAARDVIEANTGSRDITPDQIAAYVTGREAK